MHEQPSPALDDAGQAAVVQLSVDLQFAHEYSAKVAKSVAQLGTVTTPSQSNFIMKREVHSLMQLQIPPPPPICLPLPIGTLPKKD